MPCCKGQQDSQQTFDTCCATGAKPAEAEHVIFKTTFLDSSPIVPFHLPHPPTIQTASCRPSANMTLVITSPNLCIFTLSFFNSQPKCLGSVWAP